ncbi:MAG: hypothetical protein HY586_00875 [Candidatus Omnitrophica bacterium]|nr:hypothetical protein [Candidatus Omnitrophota bacterium]
MEKQWKSWIVVIVALLFLVNPIIASAQNSELAPQNTVKDSTLQEAGPGTDMEPEEDLDEIDEDEASGEVDEDNVPDLRN